MIARFVFSIPVLITLLGAVDVVWAADVNAWLDRTRISEGETVQLTLEAQGQVSGRPDTAQLDKDFDILGMSTGSRINIVNGRTDTRTTWTLTLSPKHSGALMIPALRIGNSRSDALTLEVSEAPAPASGSDADILIETELSPRESYVQGQVLYTVRLFHAVPIKGGQLSEPKPENTLVQRLGEDREYAKTRNGRRYQVIERRYALFPQTSGTLELTAPVFNGEITDPSQRRADPFKRFFGNDPFFGRDPFDDLMTPTRRVRVRGEPAELDVRPRSGEARGIHWLPAEDLVLSGTWQPDAMEVQVGEPATLVLSIEAKGLTGGQLPTLTPASVAGFNVYPDQAQRQTDTHDSGVTGRMQQKIAFIPEQPGEFALPAIAVSWWDTQANKERIATLAGRVLQVSPVAGQSARTTTARVPSQSANQVKSNQVAPDVSNPDMSVVKSQTPRTSSAGLWPWISAALTIGWLLTLVLWWWRGRYVRSSTRETQTPASNSVEMASARKQFLAACRASDAITARRALLAWATAHWPNNPPRGLEALAQRLNDPEVHAALAELDRVIYRVGGAWQGTRLATGLKQLPKQDPIEGRGKAVLGPLYPESTRL